jgi:radical SAM protein with 4Fe4S-binding SPASM domain
MNSIFKIAAWIFGDTLVRPLRLISGGTFARLLGRVRRIRRIAGGMFFGALVPPMPVRLQIETTDSCNLKCRMCTRELLTGMNSKSISLDEFQKIVAEIDPYYVTLNGLGEPLIDRTIFEKLAFLHERHMMTSMPTNGTYIRRKNLGDLADNLPDILHFSVDGATKESFEYVRVDGDFEEITANYRALLELRNRGKTRPGTKIAILCALQKGNLFDFRAMFKLVQSMPGLDSFDLVPVFDYDLEGASFAYLIPTPEDVQAVHRQLDLAIAETDDESEKAFYEKWKRTSSAWLHAPAGESAPSSLQHSCLIPWYSTYIDAKGRVYPCCYLTNSDHVMGNVRDNSFHDVWAGDTYRNFRKQIMTDREHLHGCKTCPRNDDRRLAQLKQIKWLLPHLSGH